MKNYLLEHLIFVLWQCELHKTPAFLQLHRLFEHVVLQLHKTLSTRKKI